MQRLIVSRRLSSPHVTSCRLSSPYAASRRLMSPHVASCRLMQRLIVSHYLSSPLIASRCLPSLNATSRRLMMLHTASRRLSSAHAAFRQLMLPHAPSVLAQKSALDNILKTSAGSQPARTICDCHRNENWRTKNADVQTDVMIKLHLLTVMSLHITGALETKDSKRDGLFMERRSIQIRYKFLINKNRKSVESELIKTLYQLWEDNQFLHSHVLSCFL